MVSILRKEGSQSDWGTYTSNSVVTGNFNASKDVESEHYDQIREFVTSETDAFIVSATLHHFGASSTEGAFTQNQPPKDLTKASCLDKRAWLDNLIGEMFDKYVSDSFSSICKTHKTLQPKLNRERQDCLAVASDVHALLFTPSADLTMRKWLMASPMKIPFKILHLMKKRKSKKM